VKRTLPGTARIARVRRIALLGLLLSCGCGGVEKGRYGVDTVKLEGTDQMSAPSLRTCLLTKERGSFDLSLGLRPPTCDSPPFDTSSPSLTLWRWPWTDWPTFNKAVLDKDIERIIRWYRSRGFYAARVTQVRVDPPEAGNPGARRAGSACNPDREDCTVAITITVDEGKPLHVREIALEGAQTLPATLAGQLRAALPLRRGARFDEHDYDEGKSQLLELLHDAAYAGASVTGQVQVQTTTNSARVSYRLEPGPRYNIGKLTVTGHGSLSTEAILAAAALQPNTPYTPAARTDIQREVQTLGNFAAVTVKEKLHPERAIADLELQIQRADPHELRLGVGIQSGAIQRGDDPATDSIPQWDVHLLARYSYTNVLDTLGEFRIDERPRLIFNDTFPSVDNRGFGNIVSASINQPGLIEARTDATLSSSWDYGPDPYLGFIRSDITTRLAVERRFFGRSLELEAAVQQDFYIVPQEDNVVLEDAELPTSYALSFVAQRAELDLRDSPVRATSGVYLALTLTEALRWAWSDWTLFMVRPEVRAYAKLPLDIVVAARFALAWTIITDANDEVDPTSQSLGPSVYRLRGGGANSVRGFTAGTLGVGIEGGTRRWEAMFEARVPIGASFEIAALVDFGDVSIDEFRFDYLNTSAGLGFRFHSPIGAIRLDTSFRLMPLQRLDGTQPEVPEDELMPLFGVPGAVHFTIGEAF
jgi:outer membrane protein assembly factor BamA